MAVFQYSGRARGGKAVQGSLDASSVEVVANQLVAEGITPLTIEEASDGASDSPSSLSLWRRERVSLGDLSILSRQLHSLTRAGVPINRTLRGLSESVSNTTLSTVLHDVAENIESGRRLAAALQRHPEVFSSLMVSMVHVGETAGRLEESFLQISRYLEIEQETRKRIGSAMRYPIMVLAAVGVGVTILNLFVIPAFAGIFESFGADLPWATRLLIGTSDVFVNYWMHMIAVGAAISFGVRRYLETETGQLRSDHFKLKVPLVGSIVRRATLARFCRTFAMTLRSGVPVIQCLDAVAKGVDNAWMALKIASMREGIQRGETLTRTAKASGLFTPLVLQMLAVGEETGSVDELLEEVADYYEQEVDYDLKRLAEAIEPIMIVGVGAVVLVLALGIYLPMWDLASAARGSG